MSFDVGAILSRLKLDTGGFAAGILNAQSLARVFGSTVSTFMANPLLGVVEGLKTVTGLFASQERAEVKLNAVLRATGGAAGYSLEQLKAMAAGMQELTGVGDEVILSAQGVLATFKEIKGDVFRDATQAALDMNAVVGGNLQSNVMQLGKALNDPIRGVAALREVGVSFTQAQQDQIKALAEAGDVMAAQKLILAELSSEFGGAAEAMGDTMGGKIAKLKNLFGDLLEQVGGALLPLLETLFPVVKDLAGAIGGILTPVLELLAPVLSVIGDVLGFILGLIAKVVEFITGPLKALAGALGLGGGAGAGGGPNVTVQVSPEDSADRTARKLAPVVNAGVRGVQHRVEDSTRRRIAGSDFEQGLVLR